MWYGLAQASSQVLRRTGMSQAQIALWYYDRIQISYLLTGTVLYCTVLYCTVLYCTVLQLEMKKMCCCVVVR